MFTTLTCAYTDLDYHWLQYTNRKLGKRENGRLSRERPTLHKMQRQTVMHINRRPLVYSRFVTLYFMANRFKRILPPTASFSQEYLATAAPLHLRTSRDLENHNGCPFTTKVSRQFIDFAHKILTNL